MFGTVGGWAYRRLYERYERFARGWANDTRSFMSIVQEVLTRSHTQTARWLQLSAGERVSRMGDWIQTVERAPVQRPCTRLWCGRVGGHLHRRGWAAEHTSSSTLTSALNFHLRAHPGKLSMDETNGIALPETIMLLPFPHPSAALNTLCTAALSLSANLHMSPR